MTSALIGHTGFVGGNLLQQHPFDACFNSSNIEQISGRSFDLVVCSGARAEKWKANAEPDRDRDNIGVLMQALQHANAEKVVLISTVDVFIKPIEVDEESPVSLAGLHAYGRHRRELEEFVAARFDAHVIRLPGLYGPGLKKNVIFDFLNDNAVDKIDSRGVFQFYDLRRLWKDMEIAMDESIPLLHLPAEPVSVAEVARVAFGRDFVNELANPPMRYDVRTLFASKFGGTGMYVEDKQREMKGIAAFVAGERGA